MTHLLPQDNKHVVSRSCLLFEHLSPFISLIRRLFLPLQLDFVITCLRMRVFTPTTNRQEDIVDRLLSSVPW